MRQPFVLSERRGSNSRPRPWQGRALPTELLSLINYQSFKNLRTNPVDCAPPPDSYRDELLSQGLQKYNATLDKIKFQAFNFAFSLEINFLISLSFINASTGVRVLMSVWRISSRICSKTGSSN